METTFSDPKGTGFFQRVQLAEHEEGHSSHCTEIKNEFSFTSNLSICVAGVVQGQNGYVSE